MTVISIILQCLGGRSIVSPFLARLYNFSPPIFIAENIFYNFSLQQLGLINVFIDKVNSKNICNNRRVRPFCK